jgi:acetylornithine/N-succinyldiaminopimelate aminotransferase
MLEMIQGEGGVNVADDAFQRELRTLCDEKGWLMMCDEVQCGMGRTGQWFGWQHAGVKARRDDARQGPRPPGVPIGACVTSGQWPGACSGRATTAPPSAATRSPARRASPPSTPSSSEKLMDNAVAVGAAIRKGMAEALAGEAGVVDIRGAA